MLIREEEADFLVLHAEFVVKNLEVFPEGVLIVPSAKHNLKNLVAGSIRGQATQTLLTAAWKEGSWKRFVALW